MKIDRNGRRTYRNCGNYLNMRAIRKVTSESLPRTGMASGLSWTSVSYASQLIACLERNPIMRRKRSHALRGQQTRDEKEVRRGGPRENLEVKKEGEWNYRREPTEASNQ
ncbi:hypothetical protein TNCV_1361311 [Trichonephila clavipes]|nr:hypothetical protein TNCV_1361311 [Trichonephila clavipes]